MSAPSRGRGGSTARATTTTPRGRGGNRGNTNNTTRGRGRGRGGATTTTTTSANNPGGLLQKLRTGTVSRTSEDGTSTAPRGRGTTARGQFGTPTRARGNGPKPYQARSTTPSRTSSPAPPASHRDFMSQMNEKFQLLKPKRDAERKKAIQDGFLADPEKKTSLANAITPVGTCTDMCPEFERVERIVQNMVDRAEKVSNDATGRDTPSEDRMVKRFRRSAAGYDEQLPSDIRTPETLRKTLDYLLDRIIGGGDRLATIHKFVWDRTRGIRNDFSIQQVSKKEDVKIAVECYERIARFHILSLHQLSNPDNLQEGEHFDAHQEREQLNNTLLSLMYYYDDNRGIIPLPNEPEFRAYCVLFELQTLTPDLEDRMQTWPVDLLNHPKVQTAFKLYAAAGNTIMDQGPLRPWTPFSVAQSNSGKFWTILSSQAVSYIMACVAEMNFGIVRFTALDALWRSAKSSPQGQQIRNQDWTISELQNYLAFDHEDETLEFCQAFDLAFKNNDNGEQCLDFAAVSTSALDRSSIPSQQVFSHGIVEEKRYRRTLVAVINGFSVASAIRKGLVVEMSSDEVEERQEASDDDQSMFIPEQSADSGRKVSFGFGSNLNPAASAFTPLSSLGNTAITKSDQQPPFGQDFGVNAASPAQKPLFGLTTSSLTPFQPSPFQATGGQSAFQPSITPQQSGTFPGFGLSGDATKSPFSGFGQGLNTPQSIPPVPNTNVKSVSTPLSSTFGQTTFQAEPAKSSQISNLESGTTQSSQQPSFFGTPWGQNEPKSQEPASQPSPIQQSGSISVASQKLQEEKASITEPAKKTSPFSGFNFTQPTLASHEQVTQQPVSKPAFATASQQPVEDQSRPVFAFSPTVQQPQAQSQSNGPDKTLSASSATSAAAEISKPTPSFSFMQPPSTPKDVTPGPQQMVQQTPALPKSPTTSTTPQGTPKPLQSSTFKFPPISNAGVAQENPSGSVLGGAAGPSSQNTSFTSPSRTQIESTPTAHQQSFPPAKPKFTAADRTKLVENTSRLILTQPQGLIEYFVSHHVSNLLQNLVTQYLKDQRDEAMTYIRTRHLSRKFFAIWRINTQRNILNKRTKQRRKLLAAAMQAEMERKQRDEAELEAILAATQETKRLQAEQRNARNRTDTRDAEEFAHAQQQQAEVYPSRVTGQKRKTTSTTESPQSVTGTPQRVWPSHKRSRTVGTMSEPSASLRLSTVPSNLRTSGSSLNTSRFGQSLLGRSTSAADFRRSSTQKVDSTKTDYFKLKAMGIDPNTPLVPETAKSLEVRKDEQQREKEALLASSRVRPSVFSASTTTQSSPAIQPISKPVTTKIQATHQTSSSSNEQSTVLPGEDPFLRQLREARQALAQDADWFRNQTAVLEQEIDQHEEFRKSQTNRISNHDRTPQTLANGLVKVNGFDYYPADVKSGKSLSRTEERIRKTGAHGLATRQPGHDYVPVAMSRQSALRYSHTIEDVSSAQKKRKRAEPDASFDSSKRSLDKDVTSTSISTSQKTTNLSNKASSNANLAKASLNAFAALQNHDSDEEEEVSEEEGEEYEEDENNQYYHNGAEGDTEDNDEDLFEEDEDDEDQDEEEDLPDEDQIASAAHQYAIMRNFPTEERVYDDDEDEEEDDEGDEDDDGTPGTYPQFSRAQSGSSGGMQSGPGASVDDALVLSD